MNPPINELYMFPEEVYRVGNSTSHKLSAIRAGEIDTLVIKGVIMVIPNGKGVSLFTLEGILREKLSGYAWQFKKNVNVEPGLKLIPDTDPLKKGHYHLSAVRHMPVDEYKGLLEKMGLKCHKYLKISSDGKVSEVA